MYKGIYVLLKDDLQVEIPYEKNDHLTRPENFKLK